MQPGLESNVAIPQPGKPILLSYDSAEEFSLDHWLELCRLIDASEDADLEDIQEVTVSEV